MSTYIKIAFLLILGLTGNKIFSQEHPIYDIERKLMQGDKNALKEIADYFDSEKQLVEYLGYHRIETVERQVAKRIVLENCLFTEKEINIDDNTSKNHFLKFINQNYERINFSTLAEAFLITPLEERAVKTEFREVTDVKQQELSNNKSELLNQEWVNSAGIKSQLQHKDSKCLLTIASELFKIRYRFNVHHFNKDEYIDLLSLLTHIEIGVPNDTQTISWHINKDFYPESSLNLLIYFASNYKDFAWDTQKEIFVNPKIRVSKTDKETALFQLLNNTDDAIALDAFTQLTNCDPVNVIKLAKEYNEAGIKHNYAIGIFPYKFLMQLVQLVSIYKQYGINYNTNPKVKQYIDSLKADLSFKERRSLENEIINQLTLNDISSFEYWALINESSWNCTYSSGRILDIFYSNHFIEILNNSQQLNIYLKKSSLFNHLGIIGVCNNYLKKFTNLKEIGLEKLNSLETSDQEIKTQIEKAKSFCNTSIKVPNDTKKINDANKDFHVGNLKKIIRGIHKMKDQKKMEDSLTELLSQINYKQIGKAMKEIENIKFLESEWKKYSFLERDFGFFIYDNFDTITTRKEFIVDYNKFSEFDFYKNMLMKAGLNYFMKNNLLDYDKIYDALKYNVVVAFVGGGGGKKDNEVYSIVKLLELTHKTTLGYPKKICNSNGIYGCDSQDRANYWMQYLVDNKLLKQGHKEPVSFHHE